MKEICLDARMLDSGGIGTYLKNMIQGFKNGPFKMRLIVRSQALQCYPWLTAHDLIFLDSSIYSVAEQIKLPLVIPKCDLFWSPHYNIPLLPIRAKKRVVTLHDVNHLALARNLDFVEKQYASFVINKAVKKSEKVITISEFSKGEIIKHTEVDPSKVEVIYLGASELPPAEGPFFPIPEKFVLFVGNVKPHKNLKGLAQAMKGIEGYSLVVVGKKEGFIHGENYREFSSQVIFLNQVSDAHLAYLYQKAALLAFPSFYEGFGLPPLEAMRYGTPVVVSHAASLPEICGDAVCYVDPYDPADIRRGILKVLIDTGYQKELIAQGEKRYRLYDWSRTIEEHAVLFDKMLVFNSV